jgi:hypothetical protein
MGVASCFFKIKNIFNELLRFFGGVYLIPMNDEQYIILNSSVMRFFENST